MTLVPQRAWQRACAAALALATLGLATACALTSSRWIGATFPGFFIMSNRVVASVGLPRWPAGHHSDLYQHAVVAVNGTPVARASEVYSAVRRLPPGTKITYTLRKDGRLSQLTVGSLRFTLQDYLLLFVPYLLSGITLALIGIGVWFLRPDAAASKALLFGGLAGGIFAITAADLYSPGHLFRLHVLGEAFFPASLLIHLALVFPADRVRRWRSLVLSIPYFVAAILGAAYEICLYRPAAYSAIHNLSMIYAGAGGAMLLSATVWDFAASGSYQMRQRVRALLFGLLSGFAFPGGLMFYSGIMGGSVAVNYAGLTVFLFPLSVGYAVVKHDLFEIDAMLKRGVYYLGLTVTLTAGYLGFVGFLGVTGHFLNVAPSPLFPLVFTLVVALFFNPIKDLLQKSIDRVFFRLGYNPGKMLEVTSATLTSTLRLQDVLAFIWDTIRGTMGVTQCSILLLDERSEEYVAAYPPAGTYRLAAGNPLITAVKDMRGKVFSLYNAGDNELSGGTGGEACSAAELLGALLVIPLALKGKLIGIIAVGKKESGAFFSVDDVGFLSSLANQGALSIANANAYQEINSLNRALEEKVNERTSELAQSNAELVLSLQRLKQAYEDLQRSQESLVRAEKMAALGRLAAGIAHEVNTPLGASMTSLKLIEDLVAEYRRSIGDLTVSAGDHATIATEMESLVRATRQWIDKAAAHIRSFKLHTRELQRGEERLFSVPEVVAQLKLLLSHRLRAAQCALKVSCSSPQLLLYGDPGKLSQVLTNLIVNSIDACAGSAGNSEIAVDIGEKADSVLISVTDHGPGIPPEDLERIFDEFFSTKPMGEGTGLGLSIARDIVTNFYRGTIRVESLPGQGTAFFVTLPKPSQSGMHSAPPGSSHT